MLYGKRLARAALSLALVGVGMAATVAGRADAAQAPNATVAVIAAAPLGTVPSMAFTRIQEHGMPPTRLITVPPYSLTTVVFMAKPGC